MHGGPQALVARARDYFGVETDWERVPDDPARARRSDALLALAFCVAALGVELLRSIDALGNVQGSWFWPHVAVVVGTVPLAWRRRWPLLVAALLSLHLFA